MTEKACMIRYGDETICVDSSLPLFSILGKKYTILIMGMLSGDSEMATFNQIRRGIPEASARAISLRLREMEEAGMVRKGMNQDHVTYFLTESGMKIKDTLKGFFDLMAQS
ncbi:MAG: winged helix-turn-helix transcriptional regulator [Candidatus Thermoplasmatota archaeon]|jgi:DNA-binding HxlR family transcriptional regulator|nr:winged helix-turn-helix transcriptional regulator [Candidatus Thermoplasmatota archaeon]